MSAVLLIAALFLQSGASVHPCEAAKSQVSWRHGSFSPKEICRVEQRIPLLKVGMSQEEVLKTLGLWKQRKKLGSRAIWHGGRVMHGLGNEYVLEFYWSEYLTGTLRQATLYRHHKGREELIVQTKGQ